MNPWKCIPTYLHIDGDNAQVGLWCEDCQLPSVMRFPVVQMSEAGVGVCGFYDNCTDCGELEGEDEDGDGYEDRLVCG
jgi:hypothetical protein